MEPKSPEEPKGTIIMSGLAAPGVTLCGRARGSEESSRRRRKKEKPVIKATLYEGWHKRGGHQKIWRMFLYMLNFTFLSDRVYQIWLATCKMPTRRMISNSFFALMWSHTAKKKSQVKLFVGIRIRRVGTLQSHLNMLYLIKPSVVVGTWPLTSTLNEVWHQWPVS